MSEDTSDGFADQPREIDRARTLLRELGLPTTKAHLVAHALDGMRRLGQSDEEPRKLWGMCWAEVQRERQYRDRVIAERDAAVAERYAAAARAEEYRHALVRVGAVVEDVLATARKT